MALLAALVVGPMLAVSYPVTAVVVPSVADPSSYADS
jgi:hypothetical protein